MAEMPSKYPFEASRSELEGHLEHFVDTTFESLSSYYLDLPRGAHFVDYERFKLAASRLAAATGDFAALDPEVVCAAVAEDPLVFVVLRCIVGLSPPELADLASEHGGPKISQGFARLQDQRARDGEAIYTTPAARERVGVLIKAACIAIEQGPDKTNPLLVHRLDQIDTAEGLASVQKAATQGVEYATLLYERMLGRPFASHRDSVSEHVGDIIEDAVKEVLGAASVPYHQTGRAERVEGFDQAPDFLIPDAAGPGVIIEAKLTQDDGTARDKVTRVQHLDRLSGGGTRFEVIACIDGRGFRIRREDMKKLLLATRGKVFSIRTISQMVTCSRLKDFAKS